MYLIFPTVKPHLTSEEYLQTQFLVNEFSNGVGKELQSKLEMRASSMRNWVNTIYLNYSHSNSRVLNFAK